MKTLLLSEKNVQDYLVCNKEKAQQRTIISLLIDQENTTCFTADLIPILPVKMTLFKKQMQYGRNYIHYQTLQSCAFKR